MGPVEFNFIFPVCALISNLPTSKAQIQILSPLNFPTLEISSGSNIQDRWSVLKQAGRLLQLSAALLFKSHEWFHIKYRVKYKYRSWQSSFPTSWSLPALSFSAPPTPWPNPLCAGRCDVNRTKIQALILPFLLPLLGFASCISSIFYIRYVWRGQRTGITS